MCLLNGKRRQGWLDEYKLVGEGAWIIRDNKHTRLRSWCIFLSTGSRVRRNEAMPVFARVVIFFFFPLFLRQGWIFFPLFILLRFLVDGIWRCSQFLNAKVRQPLPRLWLSGTERRGEEEERVSETAILIHLLVKGLWGYRFYAWLGAISRYGLDYT